MLETPESQNTCQGKLLAGESMLRTTKLKEVGDLKSTLTSDRKMQSLECTQLVSRFVLVQYFLFQCLAFGIVMYILCHCMLEVSDLVFDFTVSLRKDFELLDFKAVLRLR